MGPQEKPLSGEPGRGFWYKRTSVIDLWVGQLWQNLSPEEGNRCVFRAIPTTNPIQTLDGGASDGLWHFHERSTESGDWKNTLTNEK